MVIVNKFGSNYLKRIPLKHDDYTYIKVQSINLFKQSQVFRYTLYIFT